MKLYGFWVLYNVGGVERVTRHAEIREQAIDKIMDLHGGNIKLIR